MITKNKFVTVSYELRTDKDGELLETAGADRPLEFICGQGQTLEYFEMNLLDKKEGDKFDFEIPAANAITFFKAPPSSMLFLSGLTYTLK